MKKLVSTVAIAAVAILGLSACGEATPKKEDRKSQLQQAEKKSAARVAPDVTGDAEYNNYIKAQEEVYDNPASIIWCTAYPENPAAPIFTVPIAGKLTSSSVSFFPNTTVKHHNGIDNDYAWTEEAQSVDGMYHGSPAPYRYGFTPGGLYTEFTNIPTFCTTQLTEFQRQTLKITEVSESDGVTDEVNQLLEDGKSDEAQALIDSLVG